MALPPDLDKKWIEAQHLAAHNHWVKARDLLIPITRSGQANAEMWLALCTSYTSAFDATPEELNQAELCARKALALDSQSGHAYTKLAQVELRRDHNKLAVEYATRALSYKNPGTTPLWVRCRAYAAMDNYTKALGDVDAWWKLIPAAERVEHQGRLAQKMRGQILQKIGRYGEAIAAYRAVLPENREEIQTCLVRCYQAEGKLDEAIVECSKLISVNANDEVALDMRAGLKQQKKDYSGAISDLTRAIDFSPAGKYYQERAKLYELMGKKDLAKRDMEQARREF